MADRQAWDRAFDPATGFRLRPDQVPVGTVLPSDRWPNFFSRVVAKLQWSADGIDLKPDAEAWSGLSDERRERLTTILASFRVADAAVSQNLEPFGPAANNSLVAWVVFLQRRDEERHANFFDRVAGEVLELGDTKEERAEAARKIAPPGIVDLFEKQLPAMSAEMTEGRADLSDGMGLYHMTLEGMVLAAGQRALLEDLDDGVLPGIRQGVYHVELDERWHIGFGLRCLVDAQPSQEVLDSILGRAEEAAGAWGDALPDHIRDMIVPMARRRMRVVTRQLELLAAAA